MYKLFSFQAEMDSDLTLTEGETVKVNFNNTESFFF